ncbi:MAG: FAD-dependent oxidoreductase [Gemmatimonadaceae bacterium]|nr:FAD-dependent oxidoreductase [Gemmatimonadaceae bacterium]
MSGDGGETLHGPDLGETGVAASDLRDGGMVGGHYGGAPVLLVRKQGAVYAMGAKCTHYGGPLDEGHFDGSTVRCPWHHACFLPETGEAVRPPAIDPVRCYAVAERNGRLFVTGKIPPATTGASHASAPASVVIVGGGAAGFAAAEMLRRLGYRKPVTIVTADASGPVDRPNISKDYLAGTAPEEWIPLRPDDWYGDNDIELRTNERVRRIIPREHAIEIGDGRMEYGALLLATGASPIELHIPGADRPHVRYLRTLADSRAIIERATRADHAVVIGASFIGLEAAASLRTRGVDVHVVAPDAVPMRRALGPDLGRFVRNLHEKRGVRFHLERTVTEIGNSSVTLSDGSTLDADLVVIGIGVRPNVALAEDAGLDVDRGVVVDEFMRTSDPSIWAAGDIARWPDRYTGIPLRIEHWAVAQSQGQAAARSILGLKDPYTSIPFFWSAHYDTTISYVGNAPEWDETTVTGSIEQGNCLVTYRKKGKPLAVASINRDVASLRIQAAMERGDVAAVEAIIRGA